MTNLSTRQTLFAIHFIRLGNGAEAARRAGYGESGARQVAYRLLRTPAIKAAVEGAKARLAEKLRLETEELVATAKAVIEADPIEYFDAAGTLKPLAELPENLRKSILSCEKTEGEHGVVWNYMLASKVDAAKFLARFTNVTRR